MSGLIPTQLAILGDSFQSSVGQLPTAGVMAVERLTSISDSYQLPHFLFTGEDLTICLGELAQPV